jgi:hypothetical protein
MTIMQRCACKICLAVVAIAAVDQKYLQSAPISGNSATLGLARLARALMYRSDGETTVGTIKRTAADG